MTSTRRRSSLQRINAGLGRAVAWLTLLMVINVVAVIVARDLFGFGRIWMQELTTWLHACIFLLGIGYTLQHNEHVRVDIFYQRMRARTRAWIDLVGVLVLLLPVAGIVLWMSWDYVFGTRGSWAGFETSSQAGGLPYPFPSIAKTLMLVMPALLGLQGLLMAADAVTTLRQDRQDSNTEHSE
ncbi:MAG: TRAP transporter small permease subunit [Pseudomonadota bacterium]